MPPAIPDRWKDYKPVGQKIEGTRFVAFKVPLREHISSSVESDIRLDGTILLKSIPNLGLIIDLTNTMRYYDPKFFTKMGVEYEKLMMPGRVVPPKVVVDKFVTLVKDFLENNPDNDKLIGVHCTHGVNRTGYMICNYMISEMTIDPKEAIHRFAKARGHKMERNVYINALLEGHNLRKKHESSPKISNWRERKEISPEPRKIENWRDRNSRENYEIKRDLPNSRRRRSSSKSVEAYGRYRF